MACLPFCALPLSHAADLFTPPAPKADPYAAYKNYKTSAAFFNATRSGEVPELIKHFDGDYNGITRLLLDILPKDYRYPNMSSAQAQDGAGLLEVITRYELAEDQMRKAEIEQEFGVMHKRLYDFQEDSKFITALDSFLKDYTKALREHVTNKKEREEKQLVQRNA